MQGFFKFEGQDQWAPYTGQGLHLSFNPHKMPAPAGSTPRPTLRDVAGQGGLMGGGGGVGGAPPASGNIPVGEIIGQGKDALKKYLDSIKHPDEPDITVTGEDPSDMGGVGDEIVNQSPDLGPNYTGVQNPFDYSHYTLTPSYSDPSGMGAVGDEIVSLNNPVSEAFNPDNYSGALTGNVDTSNPVFDPSNYDYSGTLYNGEFGLMDTGPNLSDMGAVGDEIAAQDIGGLMGKIGEVAPYAGMGLSAYDMVTNGVNDHNFMGLVGSAAQAAGGATGVAAIPFELSGHGIIGTTLKGLFENRTVDFNSVDPSKITALDDGNYIYLSLPHGADDTSATLGMFRYNKETGQFETPSGEHWVQGGDGLSEGPDEYQRFEDWTPAQWTSYGGKIYLRDGSHTFSDFYSTDGLLGAVHGNNVTALTPDEQGMFNYNGNIYSNGLIPTQGAPDWQNDDMSGGA